MSYQVLARKWRPRSFEQLTGQQHVVQALVNGLDQGRLHHAFLFTGTRGVGKTTIARILAKCLNCETGVTSQPCGECSACVDIDEGRFVDMLEIDAASRTKVDDTRELLENVQYSPTRGRFKVYIIDEVHMLSIASFNALLKTLEEPPPHVKFVLATTDAQKIPVTILSRCLQFNLQRLLPLEIEAYLQQILAAEEVEYDEEAPIAIARAADGSMRDALSLLDQAIAYGGGRLAADEVRQMLGAIDQAKITELLTALADSDAGAALAVIEQLARQSCDFDRLLQQLAEALHRTGLIQQAPEFRDETRSDWDELAALADRIGPEDVQLFYQIAVHGRRDLSLAPDPRSGTEMAILRMLAFQPSDRPSPPASGTGAHSQPSSAKSGRTNGRQASSGDPGSARPSQKPLSAEVRAPATPAATEVREAGLPTAVGESTEPASAGQGVALVGQPWEHLIDRLPLSGPAKELARNLSLGRQEPDVWHFQIPQQLVHLGTRKCTGQLADALTGLVGTAVRVRLHPCADALSTPAALADATHRRNLSDAEKSIQQDTTVQDLANGLGAKVVPGSIEPIQ